MKEKIECRYCEFCKQIGRAETQKGRLGRKYYYCKNPLMEKIKDKWGYPHSGFIGYGLHTYESPLKLKTSPKWCPRKTKMSK